MGTGAGLPDAGLLPELYRILKIPAEQLLSGELPANRKDVGNMKRIRFYRCPQCGNLLTSTNEAHISCCDRSLSPLLPRKAEGEHFFQAECSDGEWYLTTAHPMEKEPFLTFAAWVDLGRIFLAQLYPEQDGFLRLPAFKGGALYFGCSRDTLPVCRFSFSLTAALNSPSAGRYRAYSNRPSWRSTPRGSHTPKSPYWRCT